VLEDDDIERRFRSVDGRIDATRAQIDDLQLELTAQLDGARHDLVRLVASGLLVSMLVIGIMCLVIVAVVH
jgi:hypothetical protein